MFWEATMELGSHGVMATYWSLSARETCQLVNHSGAWRCIPVPCAQGKRSSNRSAERMPTSPFMRSSSSSRAELAGRSRRLLRLLLRGWTVPFCTSIFADKEAMAHVNVRGSWIVALSFTSRLRVGAKTLYGPRQCALVCALVRGRERCSSIEQSQLLATTRRDESSSITAHDHMQIRTP